MFSPLLKSAQHLRLSSRYIRKKPNGENQTKILEEGVTFSDVHNVILNPNTQLPYPEKQLRDHLDKTSGELMKDRNKIRYGNKKKSTSFIDFSHLPIEDHVVLLFPGQGSQYVGMGSNVVDTPAAKKIFDIASEVLGYDMLKVCLEGPKEKLQKTLYCQPAVVTSSVAAFEALKTSDPTIEENLTDVAGFSVGEYSALVAAGVLSFENAIKIVKRRAEVMSECAALAKSGMLTIRVKASSKLDKALLDARKVAQEARELDVCEVANYLYCGVRVIGGTETCLQYLEQNAQKYQIEVMKRLPVSSAFHTRQMDPAIPKLAEAFTNVNLEKGICNVYSNYTGHAFPAKRGEIRGALIKQINSPVKWEQIQQILLRKSQGDEFPRIYEVGPGRQLGSMILQTSKKLFKNYKNFSC